MRVAIATAIGDWHDLHMEEIAPSPYISAPRFGLILGESRCHRCLARTPTAAVWVPSFEQRDDGEAPTFGGPALLTFIEWLDAPVVDQVSARAPWLRMAHTRSSGTVYLAHHCATCGAVQGDHFIHGIDGPYWPEDGLAFASLRFHRCRGALLAKACVAESAWMELVENDCVLDAVRTQNN